MRRQPGGRARRGALHRAHLAVLLAALAAAPALPALGGAPAAGPDLPLADPAWRDPAVQLARDVDRLHLLPDTVADPILERPGEGAVVGYTHVGDSAMWTGSFAAAELLRFAVEGDPEALAHAARALRGLHVLLHIAQGWEPLPGVRGEAGHLMRYCVPDRLRHLVAAVDAGEAATWEGEPWTCLAWVSRDQYMGPLLAHAIALRTLPEGPLRSLVAHDAATVARYLLAHGWSVVRPDGAPEVTFAHRPDMILAILRVGATADPSLEPAYHAYAAALGPLVAAPAYVESFDVSPYYKFNLDHAAVYAHLILERNQALRAPFLQALEVLRRATHDHGNAHFDAIAYGLTGVVPYAEASKASLAAWLERPRPMAPVDHRALCGQRFACIPASEHEVTVEAGPASVKVAYAPGACQPLRAREPLPVQMRIPTDFVWQRSPFQLAGGDDPRIRSPSIDYLLPYWMLRYHLEVAPPRVTPGLPWPLPVAHAGGPADVEVPSACLPLG